MELLHALETSTPFPQHFRYISGGYRVHISYTLVDDQIDIHDASIQPDNSTLQSSISSHMFAQLAQHYRAELVQNAADQMQRARELFSGKATRVPV